MKITETILLIGLGGVIAYLAFSRKSSSPSTKSLGGGSFEEPSTRSLEAVDVIETQPPINVTVNTPQAPTSAPEPQAPASTTTTQAVDTEPTRSFVNSRRRRSEGYAQQFVILDNTSFPITRAYNGDDDVDEY
jgi:hypothetical protein